MSSFVMSSLLARMREDVLEGVFAVLPVPGLAQVVFEFARPACHSCARAVRESSNIRIENGHPKSPTWYCSLKCLVRGNPHVKETCLECHEKLTCVECEPPDKDSSCDQCGNEMHCGDCDSDDCINASEEHWEEQFEERLDNARKRARR
jgi:hypothetical protein